VEKRLLFVLFGLFVCSFVNAGDGFRISGKISDNQSGESLSFIHVGISGTAKGAVSDEEGMFLLKDVPAGNCMLVLSGGGYEKKVMELYVDRNISGLDIRLSATILELDQVVVTGARTERTLKNTPISIQVLSSRLLEKMQVSTFRDVLEYEMPGVGFANNGGYANINMLGFGGKYVLFLIDGERMAGETFDNIDYNRIDMDHIERVEIVKGASSSLYGSNAVGGVINIITKRPREKAELSVTTRYGSHNEQQASLQAGSGQKWGGFLLSGSFKQQNPYLLEDRLPLTQEFADGTIVEQPLSSTYIAGYKDYHISPKFLFDIGKKVNLELKGGYFFQERHPGGMDGKKVRDHFQDYAGGLKFNYKLSEKQHLSLNGHYDRYDKYDFYKLLDEKEKNYENKQFRMSGLYDVTLADKHLVVTGAEYFTENLLTFMFEENGGNGKRDASTASVFSQQEWQLHPRFTFVTGLRYDYHSQFKGHLTPRLSFMYRPADRLTLRLGYAGGFRSPTLKELYTDWFHPYGGGFQIIGNPKMKAEVSNNVNISAELSVGKTLVTAMAQYSALKDKVSSVWLNNDTIQYVNLGDAQIVSTEICVLHQFGNYLSLRATYAYVQDRPEKKSIVRPHTATFRVDYTSSFLKKYNPVVSFSGKIFGGMDIYGTGDVGDSENTSGVSKEETGEYKVHYAPYSIGRLTLAVPLPFHFSLNVGINNLFDYKPRFSSFYSSISPGRTYYIGLKWKLE
jgi:outer membrane receptor for ferrienterochelin and colicins